MGKWKIYYKNCQTFTGTDFITAITLLASYEKTKGMDCKGLSCKKRDVLRLDYKTYSLYRDRIIAGIKDAVKFLGEHACLLPLSYWEENIGT